MLRASLQDYPGVFTDVSFNLIVKDDTNSDYKGENDDDKPYFENSLEKQIVYVGESWNYTWPEAMSKLDLNATYNVTLSYAAAFVHYNEDS